MQIRALSADGTCLAEVVTAATSPEQLTVADVLSVLPEEAACAAVCGNTDVLQRDRMLQTAIPLWQKSDGESRDGCMVFAAETIPAALAESLPVILRGAVQRLTHADLVLLDAVWLGNCLASTRLTEFPWTAKAATVVVADTGDVARISERLPAGEPELPWVSQQVVNDAAVRIAHSLTLDDYRSDCLAAGLLLLTDHADASHEFSQRNEGRGDPRTADYWHGLMHRREPDAGNAAYWFRRVGNHPALVEAGRGLSCWLRELAVDDAVVVHGESLLHKTQTLDPFRLIDLSVEVRRSRDAVLEQMLRAVQYLEMLNLLRWSLN